MDWPPGKEKTAIMRRPECGGSAVVIGSGLRFAAAGTALRGLSRARPSHPRDAASCRGGPNGQRSGSHVQLDRNAP